ncbi:MAG TPA: DUF4255 domain-containing protein [Cyanophyceae cyanobacterium]
MSNYLAIATLTATLQRSLQAAVQLDVEGARVTTLRPNSIGTGTPETGVNLYLYQVITNPALQNIDSTPFRSKGNPTKRQSALDLYYMLSVYGNDAELEPQRLLGSIVRTLNDLRYVTSDMIRDTEADPTFRFLIDANLSERVQQVNIVPMDLNLEELSKAWSVFFQTPYFLSVVYKLTVVTIEGEEPAKRALPVRGRNLGGMVPFPMQPLIEQVVSQVGKFEPILVESTLLIQGKNLKSSVVLIRIGEVEVTPSEVSDTQIILSLSVLPKDALYAGVQSLQVIHQISTGLDISSNNAGGGARLGKPSATQSALSRNVESNVAPFVLCPTITATTISNIQGSGDEPYSADITLQVDLNVGKRQRVVLALNEWSIDNPTAYLFDASPRRADSHSITVPVENIKPGEYLLRLQVDGAESQLKVDTDPDSPTFNWYIGPKVLIAQGLA